MPGILSLPAMMLTMNHLVVNVCVKVQDVSSGSFTQQRCLITVFTLVAALKGEQANFLEEQDWPWGQF